METPQVGTRHRCGRCGTEVIVVKAPDGPVTCCGEVLRYADVGRMACAAARSLPDAAGDVLAYVGAGGPAVPVALFTAAWAGASYAPLNHRLPPATLTDLAGRLGCKTALSDAEHL